MIVVCVGTVCVVLCGYCVGCVVWVSVCCGVLGEEAEATTLVVDMTRAAGEKGQRGEGEK